MKKIIVYLTIFSLLNLAGCYYQEQMNPGEYNFDENEDLVIITKDSVYKIYSEDYYLENDTVFAIKRIKLDKQSTLKTAVEIPVEEIEKVEVERTDAAATTVAVIGSIVGAIALFIVIGMLVHPEI
jgi:hypothetical protein